MKPQIISFKCTIKNKLGHSIVSSYNKDVLITLDNDLPLFGLAEGLRDLRAGERRVICLSAEKAYGLYDPQKVVSYSPDEVPQGARVGRFVTLLDRENKHRIYKVIEIQEDKVTLDGNHPLAGQDLIFEIETLEARTASNDEIQSSLNLISEQVLN